MRGDSRKREKTKQNLHFRCSTLATFHGEALVSQKVCPAVRNEAFFTPISFLLTQGQYGDVSLKYLNLGNSKTVWSYLSKEAEDMSCYQGALKAVGKKDLFISERATNNICKGCLGGKSIYRCR